MKHVSFTVTENQMPKLNELLLLILFKLVLLPDLLRSPLSVLPLEFLEGMTGGGKPPFPSRDGTLGISRAGNIGPESRGGRKSRGGMSRGGRSILGG